MDRLKVCLFGQPQLERNEMPVEIGLHKALGMLAYLTVTRQAFARDALATMFWPENDQSTARANLRRTLYIVNKAIGDDLLDAGPEAIAFNPRADVWVDVEEFSRRVRDCAPEGESSPSPECLKTLAEAVMLYKDDFLAGFTLPDCPAFDEWQFFETERLRGALARVLSQLARAHQARSEWSRAIGYARRWLALDPTHEPAHRMLMQLYSSSGQQAAAHRQYQQCVKVLQDELGTAPEAATRELYDTIRVGKGVTTPAAEFPQPPTRYTQGDVHIAYQVLGNGPVDLVFVGGFVSDLEQIWEEPNLARFYRRLSEFSRLILFDKRGMGLSDRVGHPPTLENTMDDICSVMDAVGSRRAVLCGVSEGGTSCALFAATYPERAAGLILYGTLAKGVRSDDYPWAMPSQLYDRWLDQLMTHWGQALDLEFFVPSHAHDPELQRWWARSLRIASSPGEVRGVLEVLRGIDVRVALPAIRTRTLVIHRTGDRAIRVGHGRYIASQVPGARLVELPGDDHWWWVGDADSILNAIEAFVGEVKEPSVSDRVLATILAFEITAGKDAGGVKAQDQLQQLRSVTEAHVARGRGRAISQNGHRSIVLFDGPSRAIQCAHAIGRSVSAMGISMRAGLHTGEVSAENADGIALAAASSIMEQAAPGQVLVSNIVKDLVIGSGFEFVDRGEIRAPGAWHIYALAG